MKEKKQNGREILSDVLLVAGGTAVSIGAGVIHIAAGLIVGGLLAMAFGWLIGLGGDAK